MNLSTATKAAFFGFALAGLAFGPSIAFQQPEAAGEAAAEIDPAVMELGETIYVENCASCHGEDGMGERKFAGSQNIKHVVLIGSQIYHGGEFMPKFDFLSDEEAAAVGTYIRNSWGNALGPVSAEEIGVFR